MKDRRKPTGFVAICQCGKTIGAMDYERTDHKEAGKILGQWLTNGCKIEPRFGGRWTEHISVCECPELVSWAIEQGVIGG